MTSARERTFNRDIVGEGSLSLVGLLDGIVRRARGMLLSI